MRCVVLLLLLLSLTARAQSNTVAVAQPDAIVFPADVQSPFSARPTGAARELRASYLRAAEAVYGIAVRLKLFLHVSDKANFLVSPVSVAAAIGELLLGAKGRSREQLEWLLSTDNLTAPEDDPLELHRQLGSLVQLLEASDEGSDDGGYVLHMASAFFVQPDLRMRPSYVHAVTKMYGLQFWPLDFSGDPRRAQDEVNRWSYEQTHGKIPEALPGGLPPTTAALLLNAVYFKGDWQTPFDPELTVDGVFHVSSSREVKVRLMRGQLEVLYAESEKLGCRVVGLPYRGAHAAMFLVMPLAGKGEHDLQRFLAALTFQNVRDLLAAAEVRVVTVVLPRMVLRDTLSIREAVGKVRGRLGDTRTRRRTTDHVTASYHYQWRYNYHHRYYFPIPVRFDQPVSTGDEDRPLNGSPIGDHHDDEKLELDMSGASEDLRFRVDDVLHQVVVEVSENGTEAAAISTSTVDYSGDVKLFKVDRPFMFFVRHEMTLTPLFWGVVTDPTAGQGE